MDPAELAARWQQKKEAALAENAANEELRARTKRDEEAAEQAIIQAFREVVIPCLDDIEEQLEDFSWASSVIDGNSNVRGVTLRLSGAPPLEIRAVGTSVQARLLPETPAKSGPRSASRLTKIRTAADLTRENILALVDLMIERAEI